MKHWQIAEALHIDETSLSKKLRHELPEEEKQKIMNAIEKILNEGDDSN